jgi:hypothetical protein
MLYPPQACGEETGEQPPFCVAGTARGQWIAGTGVRGSCWPWDPSSVHTSATVGA